MYIVHTQNVVVLICFKIILSGVSFALRKIALSLTSYEKIEQTGEDWELHMLSTFRNVHLKFKIGEEFDETTGDGRKCKVTNQIYDQH